ncbi:adenylate kinase family protein [Candidatus Mancarchaeum acidiphilum]|nr:AAA family ATPase [Candidatus Mancarchaeum acidiphilum]
MKTSKDKPFLIAVTGSPASGKSYFSNELYQGLLDSFKPLDVKLIEVNDLVDKYNIYRGIDEFGSKLVNTVALKKVIEETVEDFDGVVILVGHLLADVKLPYDIAIVKREHLRKLESRMIKRGYQRGKIRENLISEALDYCGENIASPNSVLEIRSNKDIVQSITFIQCKISARFKIRKDIDCSKVLDIYKHPFKFDEMDEFQDIITSGNSYGF